MQTDRDYTHSIPRQFEDVVRRYPDRLAVKMGDRALAYNELNSIANRIAYAINSRRGSRSEPVVLLLDHGIDVIAAILGVLKAGKFYVVIDPSFPTERIEYIMTDAQPGLVVTNQRHTDLARTQTANRCEFFNIGEIDNSSCPDNFDLDISPDNLVTIGYTSGSTGAPKGVVATHRTVAQTTGRRALRMGLQIDDRLTLLHSLSFGSGHGHFFISMLNGASLFPFDVKSDGIDRLAQWLRQEKLTLYHSSPSLFRQLAASLAGKKKLLSLRLVHLSGEPITRMDFNLYKDNFGPETLLEFGMGSTEARGIGSAVVDQTFAFPEEGTPIGYPRSHHKVLLIDENGREVRPGEIGEIAVKGPNLNPGYWRKANLTRAKFQSDPTNTIDRTYLTGDLAKMLPDGFLIHMGRKDLMVKIRGYRIEIGEIERALLLHPEVVNAGVAVWDREEGDNYLAGYVVPRLGSALTVTSLTEFLRKKLAGYMIPSAFVFLEALPLINGKLDRKALPKPDGRRPELAVPYAPPQTETERELSQIWSSILSIDRVGIHDNFFDLGGHSLAASRVISHVIQTFQLELQVKALFESPTIAKMAAIIEQNRTSPAGDAEVARMLSEVETMTDEEAEAAVTQLDSRSEIVMDGNELKARVAGLSPAKRALLELKLQQSRGGSAANLTISRRADNGMAPLSFAQQRLWFLSQLEPESCVYNERSALRLDGALNVEALHGAINTIIARHEVLRTTYTMADGGEPLQRIGAAKVIDLPFFDVSEVAEHRRDYEVQRIGAGLREKPFDLGKDWPLRLALIKLAPSCHVLIEVKHHIASDGWSSSVFTRELAALYNCLSQGLPSPLPELAIQYADYAVWQQEWLQGAVLEKQLAFWKAQLKEVPVLDLATDRPRQPTSGNSGAKRSLKLPQTLIDRLRSLSKREGATLFMTLLAAFQVLLHRYTGQDDISVGSPIAGRTRKETEGLIGFFVNTLVLRSKLQGNPTFRDLLAGVRETALQAYEHQDLPFERLVEELNPDRNQSQTPLFQAVFAVQNTPRSNLELSGLKVSSVEIESSTAKFDISVAFVERDGEMNLRIEYRTDLFEAATIERMLGHFQNLLEGIVSNPELRIGELPLLSEAEKHQLLVEWNDTQREYPSDKCIHQLFEEQVEKTPDAIALVFEDQQLTYRDLNSRANQLAHYLQKLGVGPNVLVGICLERSIELIVGLLGVLKAGGAYVPLDPTYPRERLLFMLEDSQVRVLITQEKYSSNLEYCTIVCLDRDWRVIANESENNPQIQNGTGDLAYVIYTSGSTGKPKGTLISHRNVARLFDATEAWFHFDASDVWTLFHSYAFDFSVWEIWGALLYGGKLIIVTDETRRSPQEFTELLMEHRVTVLNQTPSAFRQLMPQLMDCKNRNRLDLRSVIFGGEALELQSLKSWFECYGDENPQLINMYGITETTVHVTYRPIRRVDIDAKAGSVIGKPIPDLEVYLLDKHSALVPIGVTGEIYVGGAGVAKGYLGRDELTAERFVTHPFSDNPQTKIYRSGDLARWLPSGDLEYLGRVDDQVKIRGFRIELGEIESVLVQHPAIQQAVVLAREDTPGDKRLVAYVVAALGAIPLASDLRRLLQQRLPEYMVPSTIMSLRSLPLTANGKVDRRALPMPDQSRPELDETHFTPRTPVEEILANIWARVLKLDSVGIHDNFFDLGGHSLLATQVISRINDAFSMEVQLRRLFEAPTIAGLATAIEASLGQEKDSTRISPIVPISRSQDIPLSFAQQRLWFLDRLEPNGITYNVPAAFRIEGKLNVRALEQSLTEVLRRHEALRTVFPTIGGEPVQAILPPSAIPLVCIDLDDRTECEREQTLQSLLQQDVEQPFDLEHGPLLRSRLIRLTPQAHVLILSMHHIVSDGWSQGVLFRELSEHYQAYDSGQPSSLPEPAVQYADYSVWQRQWLQGEILHRQLSYWRRQLDGISPLQLPTDRPRPALQTYRGERQAFNLSPELTKAITVLSQQQGVTQFMTLLAALEILLCRYSGQTDIAVGSPIAGRTCQEIEGLIGFFVNTLVLRGDISSDPTVTTFLRQVRETTLEAYSHQDLPFEKLVEELQPERDMGHSPLFQVMFAFQNTSDRALTLKSAVVQPLRMAGNSAKFDLTLTMSERDGELKGSLNYNVDLFNADTIARMVKHFQVLLEEMVADPEKKISKLTLLTEAEKQQLLIEWNDTKRNYPKNKCIHELFEEQVERTPDAVALVFEDQQLTYRELNQRANQLAHYLQQRGVGREVLAGVCIERSLEMIIAILAILKVGGAYVPLDSSYPKERLRFMLADTRAGIVLTDSVSLRSLPQTDAQVISLDRDCEKIANQSPDNPSRQSVADDLAYVIYTSGSTGLPKGVQTPHRAIVRLLFGIDYVQLDSAKTILQMAPISFDAATFEIWGALLHGGKCVLFPGKVPSPRELGEVLKNHRVNTLWLTAALFNMVVNEEPQTLSEVKQLLIGGEALSVQHVKNGLALLPNTEIINGYGPTESTTFTCCYRIPRELDEVLTSVPIGRPIANTEIYLLDSHLNPVPVGVAGEIYISGDGLARGYLNQPELTAEKFITHSLDGEVAKRFYKTGDLARYLPDGNIEFLGRMDTQVKIRGYRVELGEIETALAQYPSLRETVVVVHEDATENKRLIAYIVPDQSGYPGDHALRSFLKRSLPEYMIPAHFVSLKYFPLTPSGKIDRSALPPPAQISAYRPRVYVEPRNPTEEVLAAIWGEVLNTTRVSVHDDFFELGGHSLLAIRLLAQLREECQVELSVRELFEAPTVAGLAAKIEATRREEGARARDKRPWSYLIEIQRGVINEPVFVVPGGVGGEPDLLKHFRLARCVGREFSFYGLVARGSDGLSPSHATVEEMAVDYLKEIRSLQPTGPYYLVGECIGGIVAYELACQLRKQNQEVALLAMMDTFRPTMAKYLRYRCGQVIRPISTWWRGHYYPVADNYYVRRFAFHLEKLLRISWQEKAAYLVNKAEAGFAELPNIFPNGSQTVENGYGQVSQYLAPEQERYLRTLRRHKPKPYDGKITMVANEELYNRNPTVGWADLVAGCMDVEKAPGTHETYIHDHIKSTARIFKACLERARNGRSRPNEPQGELPD